MPLEEKAGVVRRLFRALAHGEIDELAECFDAHAQFDFTRSRGIRPGMFHGRHQIRKNYAELWETWREVEIEPHDFVELDEDRLLFSIQGRMVGRDGIELNVRAAHIWTVKNGLITRATFYQSRDDALEDAGGSPGPISISS